MADDRVIDLTESRDLCHKAPQWRAQLDEAAEFLHGRGLLSLEVEVGRALRIVEELEG